MRFGVLGPLAVWTAGGRPVRVPEAKVRALLARLLVAPGRVVPVDRLAADLWGDDLPGDPSNTLQTKVSLLRRTLEKAEPGARELVAHRPPGYALSVEGEAVDAERFADLTARARGADDPRTRVALYSEALALWRGPAFAEFADEEFARAAIARLDERRLTALEERAEARLDLGEHAPLADELGELAARHPLRERLRAAHMRALYLAGRQDEALASYDVLREHLAGELGLDPRPELAELRQAILRHDPALRPGGAAVPVRPPRLPAPVNTLIGREDDLVRVGVLLRAARLVTLTGPGGVGKTRLALAAAARLEGGTPDGVWLVELAGRHRAGASLREVAESVAAVLGIRDAAPGPDAADPLDRLAAALRTRRPLLVLDNCEHVIEPVAALADRLLRDAPGLRLLATSREPLAIGAEVLHAVPPLESPRSGDPGELRRSPAARLLVARASATAPGFDATPENAAAIATICRRLDGLPLALELAATRVRALGATGVAERLDDRFRLLAGGRRDAPARQRTLRAVIDWSWEPLPEPERAVLRRLAVHAGGCTPEAAEEVCGDGAVDVLAALTSLVDRSLVVTATGPRYRLLESVAAYCAERLEEAGEAGDVQRRHGLYYTRLAERARPELHGHDQRRWIQTLDDEDANLRRALGEAVARADSALALRLVNALAWSWYLRGRYQEGHRALSAALDLAGPDSPERAEAAVWHAGFAMLAESVPHADALAHARTLDPIGPDGRTARAGWFLGQVHLNFGELTASAEVTDRALSAFRSLGDRWGTAAALSTKAVQALFRSDLPAVRRHGSEAARLFEETGDRWGRLQAADALANLAEINGDYAEAARLQRQGARDAEDLRLWLELANRLSALGRVTLLTGDHAGAEELHRRAMRLAEGQANALGLQFAEIGLGMTARRRGRLDDAERHLGRWLGWNRELGGGHGLALVLAELGFAAEQRGDAAASLALHREGFGAARRIGDRRAVALALEGLAGARSAAGAHAEAARLLGTAAALRDSAGAPLPPAERGDVDRVTARLTRALGEDGFKRAHDEGRVLPPGDHPATR
ncbi:BTAD domain-containing putative transcriptional regulator [Spirillospora sp. CA-294931]|uniref:BTAD domain-containing putative transcriptional regulator n=1 Tax=Spirillospora sp. CA-294931 TaxID=3240042 RepID=UPI003D90F58D